MNYYIFLLLPNFNNVAVFFLLFTTYGVRIGSPLQNLFILHCLHCKQFKTLKIRDGGNSSFFCLETEII